MVTVNNSMVIFLQNYLPLNRINLKEADTLLITEKAKLTSFSNSIIGEFRFFSPVFQSQREIWLDKSTIKLWNIPFISRKEILRRDEHQCQYCRNRKQLTIDHLIFWLER